MQALGIIFIAVIGAFFTNRTELSPSVSFISAFFIVGFAIPSYLAWIQSVGLKKGILSLLLLSIFALTIESIGVLTGLPYGRFYYGEGIGYKLFQVVPWTVPFAWVPLVLGAYTAAQKITHSTVKKIILTALLLVGIDLVLDPGAFALGMWIWIDTSWYYGIPFLNFAGWFFSGSIGASMTHLFCTHKSGKISTRIYSSTLLTIAFWTTISILNGFSIPAILGTILTIFFFYFSRHE